MVKRKPSTLLFNLCSHTKRRVECILFLQEDELCLGNVISGVVYQLSLSSASASRDIWYQADGRSMKGGPALLQGASCSGEAKPTNPYPAHCPCTLHNLRKAHQNPPSDSLPSCSSNPSCLGFSWHSSKCGHFYLLPGNNPFACECLWYQSIIHTYICIILWYYMLNKIQYKLYIRYWILNSIYYILYIKIYILYIIN